MTRFADAMDSAATGEQQQGNLASASLTAESRATTGYTDEEVAALNAEQYRNDLSCVDVALPGDRRRRVFFNEAGEARRVWLLPRGGKQTEREIRPGTNDWRNSVEVAVRARMQAKDSPPHHPDEPK